MNQQDAQPPFVVTAPANDDLLAMLRHQILPEIRRLTGERRVTIVFDRELTDGSMGREENSLSKRDPVTFWTSLGYILNDAMIASLGYISIGLTRVRIETRKM